MIEVVFTLDYEIYGNGTGTLRELVYEPAEQLRDVFRKHGARFVNFVEVAEFEKIGQFGTDKAIGLVERQIRELREEGFEVGLHLHPQWSRARYDGGRWLLDYSEYNLCTLARERIEAIADESIAYLRRVLNDSHFTPLSFRAGNWLFQPTRTAAEVLFAHGMRIDSSVFKGGVQHARNLDYRRALANGYYWPFASDANEVQPAGNWLEIPIYSEMVPFWRMVTSKRVNLQTKGASAGPNVTHRLGRIRDYLRPRYPLKFDFCRMTLDELTAMMHNVIRDDRDSPGAIKPIVAIGHTKDLTDIGTIDLFLSFLNAQRIPVSTFSELHPKVVQEAA
jgi:hypothetical protein